MHNFVQIPERVLPVRFAESESERWLSLKAPCSWLSRCEVEFEDCALYDLQPATTFKHWDVLAMWTRQIARRRAIPPLIVSRTETGKFYVHDGNHRHQALRICFRNRIERLRIRVAVLKPKAGFEFRYVRFKSYGTYQLLPMLRMPVDMAELETALLTSDERLPSVPVSADLDDSVYASL